MSSVDPDDLKAGGQSIPHRLVGHGVEWDGDRRLLHVQVDVPASGFQQSPLRVTGATVEFVVHRR